MVVNICAKWTTGWVEESANWLKSPSTVSQNKSITSSPLHALGFKHYEILHQTRLWRANIYFCISVPASFARKSVNKTVLVGQRATVECPVLGDNPIKIRWLRNQQFLPENPTKLPQRFKVSCWPGVNIILVWTLVNIYVATLTGSFCSSSNPVKWKFKD